MDRLFRLALLILIINSFLFAGDQPANTAQAAAFTSSNLPVVVITTEKGQGIPDEPKITARLGIIYNGEGRRNNLSDPYNYYDGVIGIEVRGNASQYLFDKKPWTFETRDENGDNLNVELLEMPKENDWILNAAYIDKTFIRDPLAYHMSRIMGRWASRTMHCEVVLNGVYQGLYILMESIKPDKNRLNIAKMDSTDINGENVTGGYIYEVAQGEETFGERRCFKYPKAQDIRPEQVAYIKKYDDDFRRVMRRSDYNDPVKGYPAWIDVDSFIDEILVQEACRNSDAYGWSSHFYKDRSGKLCAGPAWDFDQALSNSTFNNGWETTHWIIENNYPEFLWDHPEFWKKLFNDYEFKCRLAGRWFALRRGPWQTSELLQYVDSLATVLNEAQQRNFEKWPILGVEIWRSTPGVEERNTYKKEVDYMKTWFVQRLTWMDEQLEEFDTAVYDKEPLRLTSDYALAVYPNPFRSHTTLSYTLPASAVCRVGVYNVLGQEIFTSAEQQLPAGPRRVIWNGYDKLNRPVASGIYFYVLFVDNLIAARYKMLKF
ncbi:MAG TPA: CotH kinase family protein [bacterium]|nr:CotH kinase family protein [bacterium]HPN45752.1 CotH kinase family protein [bacterium]